MNTIKVLEHLGSFRNNYYIESNKDSPKSIINHLKSFRENYYLQSLEEAPAEGGDMPPEGQPLIDPAAAGMPPEGQPPMDPAMGGQGMVDPAMGRQPGMDPMGMGMPAPEPPKTATALGRIYEMKKIYNRLFVLDNFLTRSADPNLTEMKDMISDSFGIYKMIAGNLQSYKDGMDDIIKHYYAFISSAVLDLEDYYKQKAQNIGD